VAWVAAVLLHLALIALFLLLARHRPPTPEQATPPGVSVVFENGGAQQTAAPPAPRQGPSSAATTPAPPPPPPPPQPAEAQPEVNLNMPSAPFATLQSVPEAPPLPQPKRPAAHPRPRTPPQHYLVMNNMSFGNGKPAPPAPPIPHAHQALSLNLPQSDAQAVNAPEVTIKGNIGADWEAALTRWVNDHKYYPQAAVEQEQQGNVRIEFTVDRNGNVTGLRLLDSSGSPFLDQAWLGLFEQNQLPPFPPGTKSNHVTVDATMHFELIP
jgi:protein TonB